MTITYDYYAAVINVIDLIMEGRTQTAACDEVRIPVRTFKDYIKNNTQLQAMLEEAEQRGADAMADALLDPDGDGVYGRTDPKMAKIMSENIKFVLGKRFSKKYGDKLEVTHNITADRAIIDALNAGKNRAAMLDYDDVIDVQAIPMSEEEEIARMTYGS